MQNTNWVTNSEETPEWLDALERKHLAIARREIEARERAGLAVTPEWLDTLERKHLAIALQEIATSGLAQFD